MAKAEATKTCPGIKKIDEPAHDAPVSAFAKNAAHKDGLSRLCRRHSAMSQAIYTANKKAAAAADNGQNVNVDAKAAAGTVDQPKPAKAAKPAKVNPATGESDSATAARKRFEQAVDKATPDQREQLMSATPEDQPTLVDLILAGSVAKPKAAKAPKTAAVVAEAAPVAADQPVAAQAATPAPKPSQAKTQRRGKTQRRTVKAS